MGGGFTMKELHIIKQAAKTITEPQRKAGYVSTGLYLYTDTYGNILFVRLRMDKPDSTKWIRPLSRDHAGNWTQLKEPPFTNGKPLYHLQAIAREPDKPVFVVEGEKCANTLNKLGLIATTSGGAGSAKDANWQPLAGREVRIWPDNDEAGRQYANDVKAKLTYLNCTIHTIDISALNLPAKGDCVDWLARFKEINGRDAIIVDIDALPLKTDSQNQGVSQNNHAGDAYPSPSTDDEVIQYLASLKPLDYDRVRKEQAKAFGVQVKTLDNMVKAEREASNQDNSPFADVEPWHEAIAPAEILDDITNTILRFIVLDKHQAQTAALWVAACWFVNEIQCAPIALINAPERACGKTQLLTILGKLAPRTAQASGISPSVLFRMIEAYQPTLFIDEIETILKDNEDLRGLINAGHTRDSAFVWRSVAKGDDFEPKHFSVWGMKAIAGINAIKLAETVTSRAIVFELRRKRPDEKVERLRQAEAGLFETLARKLARFSEDYSSQIKEARPNLPNELGDRDQDNWEPLLQVASLAGSDWLNTATNAALKLSDAMQAPMSTANELLADIQEIFHTKQVIKISTTDLINTLCEDTEKSWATYNRGKQLSPRQLSTKLKDYGISSKTIRISAYETAKGYETDQFKDAFSRYLADPLISPSQSNSSQEANNDMGFNVTDKKTVTVTCLKRVTVEPTPIVDCDGVTDKTPILKQADTSVYSKNNVMEF
jgi:putative DNA primase/helicase